jgi:hypothetical protein
MLATASELALDVVPYFPFYRHMGRTARHQSARLRGYTRGVVELG